VLKAKARLAQIHLCATNYGSANKQLREVSRALDGKKSAYHPDAIKAKLLWLCTPQFRSNLRNERNVN